MGPCRLFLTLVTVLVATTGLNAKDSCLQNAPEQSKIFAINNFCLAFVTGEKLDFDDAEKYCEQFDGNLAIVNTSELNEVIANKLHYTIRTSKSFWIGLNYTERENDYKWVDGSRPEYENFRLKQRFGLAYDCVAMDYNGWWYNYRCKSEYVDTDTDLGLYYINAKLNFICQYAPTEATSQPTQDQTTTTEATSQPTQAQTTTTEAKSQPTQAQTKTTEATSQPTQPQTTTTEATSQPTQVQTTTTEATSQPTQAQTNPQTTQCPEFNCDVDCSFSSYKVNPVTRCLLCECVE